MVDHYLNCKPRKVKWCKICKIHSTLSDYAMTQHMRWKHKGYNKLCEEFKIQKCPKKSDALALNPITIKW